jgi:hypothetical protein
MTYKKYTYSFEINGKCVTFSFFSKTEPVKIHASYGEYLKPYDLDLKEELEACKRYFTPSPTTVKSSSTK